MNEEYGKTDWKFDFSSLPHWDNRKTIPYVFDRFYHIPQSDTLCCIYSIAEVGMCRYMGFLAILKNKEKPELILNIADGINFYRNFFVNKKGNIIFLQPFIYNRATKKSSCPIMVLDIAEGKYAYYATDNGNPCYNIVELSEWVFGIEADEVQKRNKELERLTKQKIDLRCLEWHGFEKLQNKL